MQIQKALSSAFFIGKGKYMADAGWIKANFPGYTGWNDPAAIEADFRATGGVGKEAWREPGATGAPSGGATTQDPVALAQQMYQQLQQFKQPAIQTLQAGQPAIGQMFATQRATVEAEKDPLTLRYQNLLKDITQREEMTASEEFSRRGIPLSSGLVSQVLAKRLGPQIERVGLEKETGLRDLQKLLAGLTTGEAQMGLDLNSAIAAIQAATGTDAITAAMQLYQYQTQAKTEASKTALAQWIAQEQQKAGYWTGETPSEKALREAQTAALVGKGQTWTPSSIPFQLPA